MEVKNKIYKFINIPKHIPFVPKVIDAIIFNSHDGLSEYVRDYMKNELNKSDIKQMGFKPKYVIVTKINNNLYSRNYQPADFVKILHQN